MKEQLMAAIAQFAQAMKLPFIGCLDGSKVTVTAIEGRLELSCQILGHNDDPTRAGEIITHEFEQLKMISQLSQIPFELIFKKIDGKLMMKNSLSPKKKVDPKVKIKVILHKYEMDVLIPLIDDDPEYLVQFVAEKHAKEGAEDLYEAMILLHELY